ncbi:MAG TPA: hypothetical protein VN838_12060 [Bradyrhizobium sp.]|nr:hypothetical protein [Bradyrhizobium sp.]
MPWWIWVAAAVLIVGTIAWMAWAWWMLSGPRLTPQQEAEERAWRLKWCRDLAAAELADRRREILARHRRAMSKAQARRRGDI